MALVPLVLLLGGCPFAGKCETGGNCDTGRNGTDETAEPTRPDPDTGVALWWYTGGARVGDVFQEGSFGTRVTSRSTLSFGDVGDTLCSVVGTWSDAGGAAPIAECPGCS